MLKTFNWSIKQFRQSLCVGGMLALSACAIAQTAETLMPADVRIPSIVASVENGEGIPSTIEIDGEVWRTVVKAGKLVGFRSKDNLVHVTYLREPQSGGLISHAVFSDGNNNPIGITRLSAKDSADPFFGRYGTEDTRSLDAVVQQLKEVEAATYKKIFDRIMASSPPPTSDVRTRKSTKCEIYCDGARDYETNYCEYQAGIGSSACDFASGTLGSAGAVIALNCKSKILIAQKNCKDKVTGRHIACRVNCSGFVYNPQ
jgi:hypothetical protein